MRGSSPSLACVKFNNHNTSAYLRSRIRSRRGNGQNIVSGITYMQEIGCGKQKPALQSVPGISQAGATAV